MTYYTNNKMVMLQVIIDMLKTYYIIEVKIILINVRIVKMRVKIVNLRVTTYISYKAKTPHLG